MRSVLLARRKLQPNWKAVKLYKNFMQRHKIPTAAYAEFDER